MRYGIDVFLKAPPALGSACTLICAGSTVDGNGEPVFRQIHSLLGKRLKSIWSLQHGFHNDTQDNMLFSRSFVHSELGIPVCSLYDECLLPAEEWLEGIDTLIIDIQDIGSRVYTFTNHMVKLACALSGQKLRWIFLDRPNPLGGLVLEGSLLDPEYYSIVGEISVPMRHGLSAAEYLRLAIKEKKLSIDLTVIPAEGWRRRDLFHGIWTLPSPNMPSHATACIYPGAVLLEGTNLSEGRGTTRPFELIGAPFIDALRLARHMNSIPGTGIQAVPLHFKPEFSKHGGSVCNGILCHQPDRANTRSYAFFCELIRWVRQEFPEHFSWKNPPYEFESHRPPIDMITGSEDFRLAVEANRPLEDSMNQNEADFDLYRKRIAPILLYS